MKRINLSFNYQNEKDRLILKLLDDRYSANDYIKEILYRKAVLLEKEKEKKNMRH